LTVTGPPDQPVGVSINGFGYGTQGYTSSSGVYSINGSWSGSNAGSYVEYWYVESVATSPLTFKVEAQVPVTSQPVTQSTPGSAPASQTVPVVSASTQNCDDISGTWTDVQSDVYTLNQTGQSVKGTISEPDPYCDSPIAWTVQGSSTGPGSFSLTEFGPAFDACSNPVALPTFSVNISITSCSAAQETVGNSPGSNPSFSELAMPLATGTIAYWARLSPPPGITMTVDLLNDKVRLVLANQNKTGTLNVVLNGTTSSSPNTTTTTNIANATNASYLLTPTYSLQRTALSPGQYSSVVATWDDINLTIPVGFYVLGLTRFSQYNTPYESQCSGNPQTAYIFNRIDGNYCYAKVVTLGSTFISQVSLNGTGVIGTNEVVKSYGAGARNICPLFPGISSNNTFFDVDTGGRTITTITGTNNTVLSDATGTTSAINNNNPAAGSVAVLPVSSSVRQPAFPFVFGDQVLMIDANDVNDSRGPRSVQDLCPGCDPGSFGPPNWGNTVAHIDSYSSGQSCTGITDYGNRTAIRLR
jgi:hypothetical protein